MPKQKLERVISAVQPTFIPATFIPFGAPAKHSVHAHNKQEPRIKLQGPYSRTVELDPACFNEHLKQYGIKVGEFLASGVAGSAYVACKKDNCDYVLKVILDGRTSDFEREWRAQELAANYDIAAKVYGHWICQTNNIFWDKEVPVYFILMERYDDTFKQLFGTGVRVLPKVLDEFKRKYLRFNELTGIDHTDSHTGNIFVKYTGNVATKLVLGDWSLARKRKLSKTKIALWLTPGHEEDQDLNEGPDTDDEDILFP